MLNKQTRTETRRIQTAKSLAYTLYFAALLPGSRAESRTGSDAPIRSTARTIELKFFFRNGSRKITTREPAESAGRNDTGKARFCGFHNIPPGNKILKKQAVRPSPLRRPATFRHRLAAVVALSAFRQSTGKHGTCLLNKRCHYVMSVSGGL